MSSLFERMALPAILFILLPSLLTFPPNSQHVRLQYQKVYPNRGLASFLTKNIGLHATFSVLIQLSQNVCGRFGVPIIIKNCPIFEIET